LKRDEADHAIQLYDLSGDKQESRNVADAFPDVVARAREVLSTARKESELFPFPEIHTRPM
jgi:hypothetical protein